MSRSRLYQEALEHYLRLLRVRALTEQVNRHIGEHGQAIDPAFQDDARGLVAGHVGRRVVTPPEPRRGEARPPGADRGGPETSPLSPARDR